MAPRKTPGSPKPDKMMRDALLIELAMEVDDGDGNRVRRLRKVARKLILEAESGDVQAIKEIADRIEGRPAQSVDMKVDGDLKIELVQFATKKKA